jgi:hypothetical protein
MKIGMDTPHTETKDQSEITVCILFGLPLIGINRVSGSCYFRFGDPTKATELIEAFWRGDLQGSLKEFVYAQKKTKDLIFRELRTNENETHNEYRTSAR